MIASSLALLRAAVFAVLVWQLLVQWMAAGNLSALLFELGLGSLGLREDLIVIIQ